LTQDVDDEHLMKMLIVMMMMIMMVVWLPSVQVATKAGAAFKDHFGPEDHGDHIEEAILVRHLGINDPLRGNITYSSLFGASLRNGLGREDTIQSVPAITTQAVTTPAVTTPAVTNAVDKNWNQKLSNEQIEYNIATLFPKLAKTCYKKIQRGFAPEVQGGVLPEEDGHDDPSSKILESRVPSVSRPSRLRPKLQSMQISTLPEETRGTKTLKSATKIGTKRMRLRRGITVDSGASANVMPRRMVRRQRIRPSPGSRRGAHYLAANNGRIANEGECDFKFTTNEGHEKNLTFQIAEVNKALGSVSYLVDNGYRVTFDKDEATGHDISMMFHKATGVTSRFRRERNIWILDALVDEESNADDSFHRQA
jgi:hypothetical protein